MLTAILSIVLFICVLCLVTSILFLTRIITNTISMLRIFKVNHPELGNEIEEIIDSIS